MKKVYVQPSLDIAEFHVDDIITASGDPQVEKVTIVRETTYTEGFAANVVELDWNN